MKKNSVMQYLLITVSGIVCASSIYFFELPAQVPLGSVSGLSLILSQVMPFTVGQINFAINAVLIAIGFAVFGRDFGAKTVYTSMTISLSLMLLEKLFPGNASIMQDRTMDIIVTLIITGLSQTVLFRLNASSGGLDIVGKIINKFFRVELGRAISSAGMLIAGASILVYDLKTTIYALVFTYFSGVLLDSFIFGMNEKKKVCVISAEHDSIVNYILNDLDSGATVYYAEGAFGREKIRELVTIIDKSKYKKLMNYLEKLDPSAFVTVYPVHEVYTRHISKRAGR